MHIYIYAYTHTYTYTCSTHVCIIIVSVMRWPRSLAVSGLLALLSAAALCMI